MQLRRICRFGDFELDLEHRVLTNAGEPIPLPPRCLAVLVVLAEARGATVGKDELIASVWKRDVSDSAVTITMHNLRTRLGPNGERLIETITGVGYRLVINPAEKPSEIQSEAQANSDAQATSDNEAQLSEAPAPSRVGRTEIAGDGRNAGPESRRFRTIRRYSALALVSILGMAVIVRSAHLDRGPQVSAYHQLTNDGRPKFPPVFTDGKSVYFFEAVTISGRIVQRFSSVPVTGDRDPQLLALPGAAPCVVDHLGNGKFLVRLDAQQPLGQYHVWNATTGALTVVGARGTCYAAVSPDRKYIAFTQEDAIFITDFKAGKMRQPIGISPAYHPRWSADGRRVRFIVHNFRYIDSSIWECNYDTSGLHMVVDGRYGRIPEDADWTPDNRLYLFRTSTDKRIDLWARVEYPPFLPHRVLALAQGPLSIWGVGSSPDSSSLYAIGESARGELVRLDLQTHATSPFLGGISAIDLDFSRDGRWVAYQRYPEHTLWRSRVDGSDALQLTPPGLEAYQPHWSPDGTRIAFMGHRSGGLFQIYVVSTDGTGLRPVKPDDNFDQGVPTWSVDGAQVVFGELRLRRPDKEMEIHVIDVPTKRESVLPGSKGLWTPRWSPNGRYIAAQTTDFRGLKLYDVNAGSWHTLADGLLEVDDPTWSRDSRFVYFRYETPGPSSQQVIARISQGMQKPEVLVSEASMPPRHNLWFTITPRNDIVLLQLVRTQEIYALDLSWR